MQHPPNLSKWNEGVRSREFSEKGEGASGNFQISSNENEVIKTILSKRVFFVFLQKRYCTHKKTHKQRLINKININ